MSHLKRFLIAAVLLSVAGCITHTYNLNMDVGGDLTINITVDDNNLNIPGMGAVIPNQGTE